MKIEIHIRGPVACGKTTAARRMRDMAADLFPAGAEVSITSGHDWRTAEEDQRFIVPANPELDAAMHGGGDAPDALAGCNYRYEPQTRTLQPVEPKQKPLYDKLVAPQGRKQVTIFVPERGIDGKTIRPLVVEKELNQVFGWYLATHGVRGSADAAKTPVIAFTVAVADDLGVRDAVGIAGRAAALTGAPVTVTLDTGDMVKVDAEGRFV